MSTCLGSMDPSLDGTSRSKGYICPPQDPATAVPQEDKKTRCRSRSPGKPFQEGRHRVRRDVRRAQAEVHHPEKPRPVLGVHHVGSRQPVQRVVEVRVVQVVRLFLIIAGGQRKAREGHGGCGARSQSGVLHSWSLMHKGCHRMVGSIDNYWRAAGRLTVRREWGTPQQTFQSDSVWALMGQPVLAPRFRKRGE